jgi:Zn-dependent protease with chaperone function
MTTPEAIPAAPTAPDRPRPDVLAYPSPTTSRYLVFLAALLSAGTFVGVWLHNQLLYDDWFGVVARCEQETPAPTGDLPPEQATLARVAAVNRCRAASDRRQVAFAFGGAATAGTAGLILLYLVPGVIERRRGLRPLPPSLQPAAERVATLAAEAGLPRPPAVVIGGLTLRDALSYGTPGRYRIALPPGAAVRSQEPLFDPLVRHELAHVAHHDVALAWLARSVWFALAPLLALPLVVGLVSGDRSLLPDYVWRAALVAVTVELVSSALLRSREHDADLRAARATGDVEAVAAAVAQARKQGAASLYRRVLPNHPSPARRRAVLERPELSAGVTFLDGFTAAFLAALIVPLLVYNLGRFFTGSGFTDLATVYAALIVGPLLGGSVGLGLWRATLVQRVVGGPTRPGPAALGVAAGLVVGQVASLQQTAMGITGGVTHPLWLAVLALAGLGATVVAVGLGELWADAAPAVRRARTSWMAALAVNAVFFAAILWVGSLLEAALGEGGWVIARAWLVTAVASWPTLTAVAVLAAAAGWALVASRKGAVAPAWLLERGEPLPWPVTGRVGLTRAVMTAVATGLVGAGTIVATRGLAGAAASPGAQQQLPYAYVWMALWVAATAGAAAALALALLVPRRGVGVGALAGPLACVVALAGFVALNTALDGRLYEGPVILLARPPLALGLVLAVLAAPAGLLVWRRERSVPRIWPAAAALSLVAVLAVVAGRTTLTTRYEDLASEIAKMEVKRQRQFAVAEAKHYLLTVEPDLRQRYDTIQAAWEAITADRTLDNLAQAARVRTEVLVPLRALLTDAEARSPVTSETRSVHLALVAALRARADGSEILVAALEAADRTAIPAVAVKLLEASSHFQDWESGLAGLASIAVSDGALPADTAGN